MATDSPVFETARLKITAHQPDDWARFHCLASDPETMRYITGGVPFDEARSAAFVRRQAAHLQTHGFCRWKLLARDTGEYLGFCGAEYKMLDGELAPEIGWWIRRDCWGRGLASEAAHAVFLHLWEEIGLPRLVSCAFPENLPSLRIMTKLGLRFEKEFDERSPFGNRTFRLVMYSRSR